MKTKLSATHLTVIIRDDNPLIHCEDVPIYRRVTIELTDEQKTKLYLKPLGNGTDYYEQISKCFLENLSEGLKNEK